MFSETNVLSKKIAAIATAIVIALTSMVGVMAVNTGSAAAAECPAAANLVGTYEWKVATWGRGCAIRFSDGGVWFVGNSDDTKEDGYCVVARKKKSDGTWANLSGSQSCGPIVEWDTHGGGSEAGVQAIRLVNGSGNYMTLWN